MADVTLPIDLTQCDQEPIHVPGSIQPHGILLVVDPATSRVLQAAGATDRLLGRALSRVLGAPLEDVLGPAAAALVRSPRTSPASEPIYLGSVIPPGGSGSLDLLTHERDGLVVLELEPAAPSRDSAAQMLAKVTAIGAALEAAPDLARLCQAAAREVRRLIGFDRVMVYRFLEDGAGCVVAEDKLPELPPFLNHHYPASDIPRQARALYVRNPVRVIPDRDYAPAPLVPAACPATGQPLDMSDCILRSVSPVHVQYLGNMGVAASMSVSILRDGALWGLIACHHTKPKPVPYELREACKHVGQMLAQQIRAREDADLHMERLRLSAACDELMRTLARADAVEPVLFERCAELRSLIPADGAAILLGGDLASVGHVPAEEQIRELAAWALRLPEIDPYATDRLSERYRPASDYAASASGLLSTVVSREAPLLLMWFRAERIEVVNWAGNPHEPAAPGADLGILTPRKSFELWKETVRGRARPWSLAEIETARRLRDAVFDLRQRRKLRDLNAELRRTLSDKEELLVQKDLLMREVNHRVQNSLQLVNAMLSLQAREALEPQVKAHFDEAQRRIMAVSMVHQRLWRSDQIQTVDFAAYLRELCEGLVEAWGRPWASHLKIHAAPVLVPTDQAIVLALMVVELLTNAVKYAYEGEAGPIEVTVREEGQQAIRVTVADYGTGMRSEARPSGLGSRLTRALAAQLGGRIDVATSAKGTRVTFTAPLAARRDES